MNIRGGDSDKITQNQKKILHLLTEEFETPKNIASRLKISFQAVYKTISKLRKKGIINREKKGGLNFVYVPNSIQPPPIRLHKQQFKLNLLAASEYYHKLRLDHNRRSWENNTIQLFKKSILVTSHRDFYAGSAKEANDRSMKYWIRFFSKLEDKCKVRIIGKEWKYHQYNAHFSEINNELAKECNEQNTKIYLKGSGDDITWLIVDKSLNVNELEAIHPQQSQLDMDEVVRPFFNDLRDKEHLKLSEISQHLADTVFQVNEISHGLKIIVNFLKSNVPQEAEGGDNPDYFG